MKTLNNDYDTILTAALESAGLTLSQVEVLKAERQEDMTYLVFRTDWVKYETYVSADGQVLGLNSEPSVDAECLPYKLTPVIELTTEIRKTA